MPPSPEQYLDRQAKRRLAIIRHVEEITGNVSLTCRYYGIGRPTYYTWYRRYQAEGIPGLRDRSSAARTCPHATTPTLSRSKTRSRPVTWCFAAGSPTMLGPSRGAAVVALPLTQVPVWPAGGAGPV
jgi:transposase-like protein